MATPTVRTTIHSYPQEELDAMTNFYGGKRCVTTKALHSVQWSHTLDAALEPSNMRLSEMLTRRLRQNRHERHAAEVRENIVPLNSNHHIAMDEQPTGLTLFLHEDTLARTLAYEQDLQRWRIAELEAGRGDPGRPSYEEAFGDTPVTRHRCHAAGSFEPFTRNLGNGLVEVYSPEDCPGIGNPISQKPFPVIDTLLSIPFSLLHTLPRLIGIVPLSMYQQQLITMGAEISGLWWWDPSPNMIEKSEEIRLQNNARNQHNGTRNPKPDPIDHRSRNGTTFSTKRPIITYGTPTTHSSSPNPNRDVRTFELPSGQIVLGTTPCFSLDRDGLLLTAGDEGLSETGDVQHAGKGIVTGVRSLLASSEAWGDRTVNGTEDSDDSDDIDAIEDVEEKLPTCPTSFDIVSWHEKVAESAPEPLPLIPGSFERGVIGGQSVNDLLMVKGLINPPVYIQFLDLSIFSRL